MRDEGHRAHVCPAIPRSYNRLTWQHVDESIFELVVRQVRADEMRRIGRLRRHRQLLKKLHTFPSKAKNSKYSVQIFTLINLVNTKTVIVDSMPARLLQSTSLSNKR